MATTSRLGEQHNTSSLHHKIMSIQSKHQFVSDEDEDTFEEMAVEFQQIRLAHQRFDSAMQKAHELASDVNGVAIFQDGNDGDDAENAYITDDEDSEMCKDDNETVATCVSAASTVSSKSTTTFVSARVGHAGAKNARGSSNVKTRLRAIASIINPKMNRKSNNKCIWNPCFDIAVQEYGVEVEYCKQGDLYEC
jgi:hypothetical protein